jgi:hypothetical protein
MYLEDYEKAAKNGGLLSYHKFIKAGLAAAAFDTLYQITHNQDDAASATRLACESIVWLRYWREDRLQELKRDRELAKKKGLSPGLLPGAVTTENTNPYKFLLGFGKDPEVILKPGSPIKMTADCKSF